MTHEPAGHTIEALRPEHGPACAAMTFPAYRHLLALAPALRLPNESEQRLVQPVGTVARDRAVVVGLALAEVPVNPADGPPELLSLFVASDHRRRGIGSALIAALEDELRARGWSRVEATYTTGKPSIAAVERIFAARGWEPPELRSVTVRATLREAVSTPWYGRARVPKGGEIFSWSQLTAAERAQLQESNRRSPWIPFGLQPWRHDEIGFEPLSSVGLRYRGEVVGWLITHRVDARTVRFTCSFMRKDLSRRAAILPLYSEAIRRLADAGCEFATFITPPTYPEMIAFIRQHISPCVSFTGETRGTRKVLMVAAAGE